MIIKYLRSVFKEEPYAGLFDISLHKDNKTKIYRYIYNHAVINRKVPLPEAPCGLRVVRINTLRFLARCLKRRLNQALSVLSLSLGFF